jgi:DNA-binding Lrp family transcriptional regulator
MTKDSEIDKMVLEILSRLPGATANVIVPEITKKLGVTVDKVRKRLISLEARGLIVRRGTNFYPVQGPTTELARLLQEKRAEEKTDEEDYLSEEESEPEQRQERARYLLIYDIPQDVPASERAMVYYRLNKAIKEIEGEGGRVVRLQRSVIMTETEEDARRLASCLPKDRSKVWVFRVVEEA